MWTDSEHQVAVNWSPADPAGSLFHRSLWFLSQTLNSKSVSFLSLVKSSTVCSIKDDSSHAGCRSCCSTGYLQVTPPWKIPGWGVNGYHHSCAAGFSGIGCDGQEQDQGELPGVTKSWHLSALSQGSLWCWVSPFLEQWEHQDHLCVTAACSFSQFCCWHEPVSSRHSLQNSCRKAILGLSKGFKEYLNTSREGR